MAIEEKRILDALRVTLEERYPQYFSLTGYAENALCMEKVDEAGEEWAVYVGDHGLKKSVSRCKTLLAACVVMMQKIAINGDTKEMEARFLENLCEVPRYNEVA